jgi:peroxiredoxin
MKIIIGFLIVLFTTPLMNVNKNAGYDIGDYATDFSLKNVDGNMVSMADYQDAEGFILSFTCNTCPYSIMYEQRIIDLDKKYAPKGYPVIAINPNDPKQAPGDSFDKMVERSKEKSYPFPYLYDESQEVTEKFGATNTPHMYILKKENNKYRVTYIGTIDNNPKSPENVTTNYIDEAMEAILSGQNVPVSKTKAIGCTIKWKPAS